MLQYKWEEECSNLPADLDICMKLLRNDVCDPGWNLILGLFRDYSGPILS